MPLTVSSFAVTASANYIAVSASVTGAGAGPVIFSLEIRTPAQAEGAAGNTTITQAASGGGSSIEVKLPSNSRSFIARCRATEDSITYTAWSSATYTDTSDPPVEGNAPQARTVTYKTVRDSVAVALEMDLDAGLTEKQASDLARHITTAYRYCLRFDRWEEAIYTDDDVDCTNGLVEWTAVQRGAWYEFWTADPRPVNNQARRIASLKPADQEGIWLDTTQSTVFARYIPRAPRFSSVALVAGTTYAADTVRYHVDSGQVVQSLVSALGSDVDDPTKWVALPILAILEDAVSLRAQAEYRSMEQQRLQAADLREQAEEELNRVSFAASLQNRD
jgi:hypothetical protein